MLVLDSIRAVGSSGLSVTGEGAWSFERMGTLPSIGPGLGLRRLLLLPLPEAFRGLGVVSASGGGAAGNRNSGMGLDSVLEDLRCTDTVDDCGLLGVPGIRPNRSGGYEALNKGEEIPRCEKDPAAHHSQPMDTTTTTITLTTRHIYIYLTGVSRAPWAAPAMQSADCWPGCARAAAAVEGNSHAAASAQASAPRWCWSSIRWTL